MLQRFDAAVLLAALSLVLGASSLFAQFPGKAAPENPWLIEPDGARGPINTRCSEADLIRAYGRESVMQGEIDLGEGATVPGTILFPSEPHKRLEIIWKDKERKRNPELVRITGQQSLWATTASITLGTNLKKLEEMNGKPFRLAGFEWDYAGTVTSWQDGNLAEAFGGEHHVIVRLSDFPGRERLSQKERDAVAGAGDFLSSDPVMRKLNPTVYQIVWTFRKQ